MSSKDETINENYNLLLDHLLLFVWVSKSIGTNCLKPDDTKYLVEHRLLAKPTSSQQPTGQLSRLIEVFISTGFSLQYSL